MKYDKILINYIFYFISKINFSDKNLNLSTEKASEKYIMTFKANKALCFIWPFIFVWLFAW